jgi:hypothetical protein
MKHLIILIIGIAVIHTFSTRSVQEHDFQSEKDEKASYRRVLEELRQIIFSKNTDSLLAHIDQEVHHYDYVRSRNDLDSVWHISELQEDSEIWGYLETRILAERIRPACLDTVHYNYLHSKPLLIPCDYFYYLNDTLYEDYYTIRKCEIFSDQDLKKKIGSIESGAQILTNWEEFELALDTRQDVLPIRERVENGITGWVHENDVFNFTDGPYLLINWKNNQWVISGM